MLVAGLALAGLALGRRSSLWLAWVCLGFLLPVARGELPAEPHRQRVDLGRPAAVAGRVASHWRRAGETATATLAVESLQQRGQVFSLPRRLIVSAPADAELPGLGTRVRLQGQLYRSSGFWNRRPTPPGPTRLYVKSTRLIEVEEAAGALSSWSARLRARVDAGYRDAAASGPGVALARALALGDTSALPATWKRGLRRWGLSHVLSVSGLHIGMVVAAALVLGTGARRGFRLALAATAVVAYILLVGPSPAILRSALMAALAATALLLERPPQSGNSLAVAAGVLVAWDPSLVLDLGFQLTVAATAGLVFLAPRLEAAWTRLPRGLSRPLAATVGAQVATIPWALPAFHLLAPAAPLANLLFIPWMSIALLAALAWTMLAVLAPGVARASVPVLDFLAAPVGWLSASAWGPLWTMPVALGGLGATALALGLYRILARPRALGLAALAVALIFCLLWPNRDGGVTVVMLDVGQGDAILLRDGRHALLVDGGGWEQGDLAGAVLLPALLGEGVRRLDAVVLSHGDRDHCRGLVDLFDYLPIGEAWMAPGSPEDGCGSELAQRSGERRIGLAAGDELRRGRWSFRVLHPAADDRFQGNDASLVLKGEALGRSVLLAGDIEGRGEAVLGRRWGSLLAADLLKVAHHGSRTSSTRSFLALAEPRTALISAGRANSYGHPAAQALERLQAHGAQVLRTDRLGALRVELAEARPLRVSAVGPPSIRVDWR